MNNTATVAELVEASRVRAENGPWIPGTGEEPFFTRSGVRLLYCWQPSTGRKAYLDMGSDLILTDQEARNIIGIGG